MSAYELWNDALASRFFNQGMAGRNVYLYINQGLISEIEQEIGQEAGTFHAAVVGPIAFDRKLGDICRRAFQAFTNWRATGSVVPPYIGYLSFFVLAAGTDGDFAPHAYYPRLWKLLTGESRGGQVPWFERIHQIWDDLEKWTVFDKRGNLGIFQSRPIGGYVHVGYPLSQTILTEQDRRALPKIFHSRGLDPTTAYPNEELARALRTPIAKQLLRTRTMRLMEKSKDLYAEMLDVVAEELANWDGTVTKSALGHDGPAPIFAGLRICIELDPVSGSANATVRCKINREFPEDGLVLDGTFLAEEDVNGWSLPIKNIGAGKTLDASLLDWHHGRTMNSDSAGWRFALQGRQVRIFTDGIQEGISGLVETTALPRHMPFYLAYPDTAWLRLERWAITQCQDFQDIEITQGLPESWKFASVASADGDEAVKDAFPMLSFPSGVRLRLIGGIRSDSGNNFFSFAPPSVALQGRTTDIEVYCNDLPLAPGENDEVFILPENLPTETRIVIEARSEQSVSSRQSLFLTGDFSLPLGEPVLLLDNIGSRAVLGYDGPSIAGAYVKGQFPQPTVTAAELFEDLAQEIDYMRGFLIGQQPGQVVAWPSEPFPREWIPEWIIQKGRGRKKLRAIWVGNVLRAILADIPVTSPTYQEVQTWKKVLWHFRKRVIPPGSPAERARWNQIQKAAQDV